MKVTKAILENTSSWKKACSKNHPNQLMLKANPENLLYSKESI
jgi:hypothetical protein